MVCCVDFPVQTVKLFLSCIIGAGAQNRDRPAYWCTESRSTGIAIVSMTGSMEVLVVSLCSGVETMIGYEIVTLTLDHPRLTAC